MYISRTLTPQFQVGQVIADTVNNYGLGENYAETLWADDRNRHLLVDNRPPTPNSVMLGSPKIYFPVRVELEHRLNEELNYSGLRPNRIGATAPPTCTHGARIRVSRNLGRGTNVAWLQTVKRENDPDPQPGQPLEFVDVGGNNTPFTWEHPEDRLVFNDVPCGQHPASGPGLKWSAMLTLAFRIRHPGRPETIALIKGITWGFETLADQVRLQPVRPASQADYRNQLRILRVGVNQLGQPTGPGLTYVGPPAADDDLSVDP